MFAPHFSMPGIYHPCIARTYVPHTHTQTDNANSIGLGDPRGSAQSDGRVSSLLALINAMIGILREIRIKINSTNIILCIQTLRLVRGKRTNAYDVYMRWFYAVRRCIYAAAAAALVCIIYLRKLALSINSAQTKADERERERAWIVCPRHRSRISI